ncbi:MAG: selenium metabolism-associated LysR family transcriptional regulator [Nitrospiraceae bacterium]|nr:selenium metabolism-associated LysR family transcriptional regulator [Nitrospiraceae bacterium]
MDLHQIEIFCAIVRLASFSRAAEALYLTQPTVSGHMKNLEAELGVKLLDRLGKRAIATEAGQILFRHGARLLEERDRAKQEIGNLTGRISGVLTIGGSTIPGAYLLPPLIGAFKKKHPSIRIQLSIEDTAKITEAVLAGSLCIGVVGARLEEPQLEVHPFQTDELVVAVPRRHPWAGHRAVRPADLKGQPFILREQGSGTRRIMEDRLAKAGIQIADLDIAAVVGSSDAVRQAVKAGLGISILSRRALTDDIAAGRLAALRVSGVRMERPFFVILLKGRSRSPLCKAFLDLVLRKS